jgi:photosystem II stability/assembly factor-like uncharacterized protein
MMSTRNNGSREVRLYVGTRKGGFCFRSDEARRKWTVDGPFFAGTEVNYLGRDRRTDKLWCARTSAWWGSDLQMSTDDGRTWNSPRQGVAFARERELTVNRIWRVVPDRDSRPDVLWCGVDPGALFRSDDGGNEWYEVTGLNQHPSRERWVPGGGGLMVHCILPDPTTADRVWAGISAAGCFRSDDDGRTWTPMNKGVRCDFQPQPFPEVGQCVHSMHLQPVHSGWIFQQNHCGVYRSRDGGAAWDDISEGLPSRFGFASAVHPRDPETMYVVPQISSEERYVCDRALSVYRTQNGGRTWQRLSDGLPQEKVFTQVFRHAATCDACDEVGIYVGTIGGALFFSTDAGDSWHLLEGYLPPILSLEAAVV